MTATTTDLLSSKRSVLGRAFDILECFAGDHADQSIASLCEQTGLPPATVHRMLANLVEWGAVERAGRGRYRLGRRLWLLGRDVPSTRALKDVARPCLVDLHTMTNEIAILASPAGDGDRMVVSDVIAGRRAFRGWTAPRHLPIPTTAPGLVMLAHLPNDEARAILERTRSGAAAGRQEDFMFWQRLAEIRRTGVAMVSYGGRTWVSSPVFDDHGFRSTISAVVDAQHANLPGLSRVVAGAARAISQGVRDQASAAV